MRAHTRRSGLSLVELLVVLAIIGILIGLSLSAVQKVRAAAARAQCANKMRQLGLALHGYHDARGTLPTGCSYRDGKDPQPYMSWLTRLLPHVEQDALWRQSADAFAANPNFLTAPHRPIRGLVVPAFVCPADGRATVPFERESFRAAFTSYLGVAGLDSNSYDGLFYLDSRLRLADITDGTSHTLAVGERPPSAEGVLGWWYAGWGQNKDGSAEMLLGVREVRTYADYAPLCRSGPYHFSPGRAADNCDALHFWSHHPGGGHFLFADGSVRFVAYAADSVLPDLATRSGGEAAVLPE